MEFLLIATVSTQTLGSTQLPVQWITAALIPGYEYDHSPPSSAEVTDAWSYTSTPPIRLRGCYCILHTHTHTHTHLFKQLQFTKHKVVPVL